VYLVPFSRYSKLLVESSEFFVPHLYLVPPLGVTQWNFATIFGAKKNYRISGLLCVVVICVMIGPTFSCFYIELRLATVASFDGRTDRHRAIHTGQTVALAWCCAVKSRSSTRRPEPQYNSLVYSVIYCAWTVERSINARSVSQLYMYRRVATSDECDDIMTSSYTRRS